MKKIFILSLFLNISHFGIVSASSDRIIDNPDTYAAYSYFFCNYESLKTLETDRNLYGKYQKSVADKMWYHTNAPSNYCYIRVNKYLLKKYSADGKELNSFIKGVIDMTDTYALAAYNLEALKITGKGRKLKAGDIHVLPGGYAKQFTDTGKWIDIDIKPTLQKLNSVE